MCPYDNMLILIAVFVSGRTWRKFVMRKRSAQKWIKINMRIMIMDGQGGGVGRSLIEELHSRFPEAELIAVGTNAMATANMMKGGTSIGATGENAVIYNSSRVDAIVGPIGIVMANAMLGEITPKMAEAVAAGDAKVFLIPMNRSQAQVVGVENKKLGDYIREAADRLAEL